MAGRHKANRSRAITGDKNITENLDAMLAELSTTEGEGMTSREMRLKAGCSRDKIKKFLQDAIDAGEMIVTGIRREPDITGRMQKKTVYAPTSKK